jgi:Tfp pilus assembly protein PilN
MGEPVVATAPQVQRIRINLLPPEIPAARRAKKLIPVAIILILLSVLGTGGWVFMWMRGVTIHEDALADATQKADAVHALESRTSEEQAKVAPLQDMIAFLDQFETHSSKYADVVEAVARYLPASCTIESINVNDDSVQFSTVVGDTEELIKLLINMNRCAMPAEGGGSEPLWSDDAISRGPLTALFSGPIEMSANFGGLTVNETLLPSTDPAQAISGALSSTAPMPGAGEVVYENGLLWQGPIPVTITGTLANPISFEIPGAAAAADAAAAGGMGMGMMAGAPMPPADGGSAPASEGSDGAAAEE